MIRTCIVFRDKDPSPPLGLIGLGFLCLFVPFLAPPAWAAPESDKWRTFAGSGHAALEKGLHGDARALFQEAMSAAPTPLHAYYTTIALSRAHLLAGDLENAARALRETETQLAGLPETAALSAMDRREIARIEAAAGLWREAGKPETSGAPASGLLALQWERLAQLAGEKGDPERATLWMQRALETWKTLLGEDNPLLAVHYGRLGGWWIRRGDWDKGQAALARALALLAPDASPALRLEWTERSARGWIARQQWDKASALLDQALSLAREMGYPPGLWPLLALAGEAAEERGAMREAALHYGDMVALAVAQSGAEEPETRDIRQRHAQALQRAGQHGEALAQWGNLAALAEKRGDWRDRARAMTHMAEAQGNLGQTGQQEALLRHALTELVAHLGGNDEEAAHLRDEYVRLLVRMQAGVELPSSFRSGVLVLQGRLLELGFDPGELDGQASDKTLQSLNLLERQLGFPPTTRLTPDNWRKILSHTPDPGS